MKRFLTLLVVFCLKIGLFAQLSSLPARPKTAMKGAAFAQAIEALSLQEREEKIYAEAVAGNVPDFWRKLAPITVTNVVDEMTNVATYQVTPDYLVIGTDDDYFYTPLTPFTAQRLADHWECSLPTTRMVDDIYAQAALKMVPSPVPPTPAMVTVPIFRQHNETVVSQRKAALEKYPLGVLVAGHKKDVVISKKLLAAPGKVAIYGWHQPTGKAIQPLYTGHTAAWADYSHGIRFVQNKLTVNGAPKTLAEVFGDEKLAGLLSNEGVLTSPKYVFTEFPKETKVKAAAMASSVTTNQVQVLEFKKIAAFDEEISTINFEPKVRIQINAPSEKTWQANKKLLLVFYTLPNGNTIEQTAGKELKAGNDWHFNIQHIAAQTRFLRQEIKDRNIVVVYLESGLKSWPAWRKQYGDEALPKIIDLVKAKFSQYETKIVLSSHSGGGSFIFGYLNKCEKIPDEIERIIFLDSNYGYDTKLHRDKLVQWLKRSDQHHLDVLAYNDAVALLDGKTFVSAAGGTWGKSHLMVDDMEKDLGLTKEITPEFQKYKGMNGRVQFLLKENPEKKIFHTVQVERNGFIHCLVAGTPLEGKGYEYFGERAYTKFITAE